MRDGKTAKLNAPEDVTIGDFLDTRSVKLVVVSGDDAGEEFEIDRTSVVVGRGPAVDWVLRDGAVSRQHAAIEFTGDGFRVRDLGSTNGVIVDGERVQVADLRHGDRFEIGEREFQLVIEERERTVEIFELSSDA